MDALIALLEPVGLAVVQRPPIPEALDDDINLAIRAGAVGAIFTGVTGGGSMSVRGGGALWEVACQEDIPLVEGACGQEIGSAML
jgi:hypothetical protein